MKRIFTITAAILSLFAFASCNKEEVEEKEAFTVTKSSLAIPAKGGEATIELEANESFTALALDEWITVSTEGTVITVTAPENDGLMSRYAQVLIKSASKSVKLTVQQYGQKTTGFNPGNITTTAGEGTFELEYEYEDAIKATTDADWITLDIQPTVLKITIAENKTQATVANRQRVGKIDWVLGGDKGTITVSQRNINFMSQDSNWTLSYEGVTSNGTANVETIKNTVAASGSGKYAIAAVLKSEVTESGMSLADYIDVTLSESLSADVKAGKVALHEETATETFDIFDAGYWYAVAVGFDANGDPTGRYNFTDFTKVSVDGGYETWLGEWTSTHGTSKDTWVIAEKVKGESYTLTGIDGVTTLPLEATYDSDTHSLIVKGQIELGTMNLGSTYGDCSMGFYGCVNTTLYIPNSTSGAYTVFTATLSDVDNATLTPGKTTSSGSEITFDHCKYIGKSSEGKYVSMRSTANSTPLPSTITRVGGSGGGDGGSASAAYKKWIGSWTSSDGTLTFAENVANTSYTVTGFGQSATVNFDSAKGGVNFTFQQTGSSSTWTYYLAGDDGQYMAYGDNDNAILATGAISSDGKSFTMTGNKYTYKYSDGSTHDFDVAEIGLFGYGDPNSTGTSSWYSFSNVTYFKCPGTFNLSSSSAAPKAVSSIKLGTQWTKVESLGMAAAREEMTARKANN